MIGTVVTHRRRAFRPILSQRGAPSGPLRHPSSHDAALRSIMVAARLAACASCDQRNPDTDRCRACGCGDTVTRRAAAPWSRCPLARWPSL